jgi:hypothetical protein
MQKPYTRQKCQIVLSVFVICLMAAATSVLADGHDFDILAGEWIRSDGDYKLHIQDVKSDGSVVVGYFNPGRINVSEASVSLWKGLVKLFVKLQDKGYPGSTYTVYYYTEKDALAGFYYQAEMKQTFKVIFFRNPDQ